MSRHRNGSVRDLAAPALLTDWYQLTMMQAYLERAMTAPAVFELFVRHLPTRRGFLVAAGLEQVVATLRHLRFRAWELDWLRGTGRFSPSFLEDLAKLRFDGDLDAMPEGTVCFADEPILRVTASLPVAQLVETRLLNLVSFETSVASKAARCVLAAPGKLLIEFGLRRAHGAEAGLLGARAAVLAGMHGTSNTLAAARFGLTPYGTMAHSFIEAHDDELEAFAHFARSSPDQVVLLLDTYDTETAARRLVDLAPRLEAYGLPIHAVRLDSGDLGEHARRVRRILDEGGLERVRIFASGGLDENDLAALVADGAPIDGFGVGTRLVVSADAPSLDTAYKLMVYDGRPRMKRSEGKRTWPGAKQVWRVYDERGRMREDLITLADESPPTLDAPEGRALLRPILRAGRVVHGAAPTLAEIRAHGARELARLPAHLRSLAASPPYPVHLSAALRRLGDELYDRYFTSASAAFNPL